MSKILVIDDEKYMLNAIKQFLEVNNFKVTTAQNGKIAYDILSKNTFDIIISDLKMPEMDGLTLIKKIKKTKIITPIIVLTAFGTMDDAVECMKVGANDFLAKPFKVDELLKTINKLLRPKDSDHKGIINKKLNMIGESPAFRSVIDLAQRIAKEDIPVLLLGETGVGKEEFAKMIHIHSPRSKGNFISVNCGAIPQELIESELFGYKKGAFTGAYDDKKGIFESGNNGTVFLDEIGDLPLPAQIKLLRFLENNTFLPIGDTKEKKVNIRMIFATNKDLKKQVKIKEFREDLYYRINIFPIYIPPLRERKEDIPLLIKEFIGSVNREIKVDSKFYKMVKKYNWPGNIRELKHFIERVVFLDNDNFLGIEDIPRDFYNNVHQKELIKSTEIDNFHKLKNEMIKTFEFSYFSNLLEQTGWNINKAAKLSGLSRKSIYQKIENLNIKKV
ncbi:sigma-54-dependent Fis family transcriptional regulator [bacterium]|nr:sigma-54-dependent Fis family transcriptional regulator [bacterium]